MLKSLRLLFFVSCLLILGCASDDNSSNNNNSFMSAIIDSNGWESSTIEISNLNVFGSSDFQQLLIRGANDNFKISIAVNEQIASNCITLGTYSSNFVSMDYAYLTDSGVFLTEYYNDPIDDSLEPDAIINITQCNNGLVSGTFSGTLYKGFGSTDTVSITEGEFQNVPFNLIEN